MNKKDLDSILDLLENNKDLHPAQRRHKRMYAEPYPDYAKGLVAQNKGNPIVSAISSALGYGSLGSIIGGVSGHLIDDQSPHAATIGAVIGALLGGGVGAYSGHKGQESRNSKLNALKRLGIDTPLEQEAMSDYPILVKKITEDGYSGGYKR